MALYLAALAAKQVSYASGFGFAASVSPCRPLVAF